MMQNSAYMSWLHMDYTQNLYKDHVCMTSEDFLMLLIMLQFFPHAKFPQFNGALFHLKRRKFGAIFPEFYRKPFLTRVGMPKKMISYDVDPLYKNKEKGATK